MAEDATAGPVKTAETLRVGFIGLGSMGAPMARLLLDGGVDVTVHNRTRERELPLADAGARRAATPAEAAAAADVVITMVPDTPDVERVLFGSAGVAAGAAPGVLVVDMSTISPAATRTFGARLGGQGLRLVDAPVSGGPEGAARGALAIMAGGDEADVDVAQAVLAPLGSVTHVGPLGAGQATKAVNQVIVGGFYLALAEGLILGMEQGLDMDRVLDAISGGACRSWILENRARNMLDDSYPLGFRLSLHRKDLRIALEAAREAGLNLQLASLLGTIEDALVREGHGDLDVSVVARAVGPRSAVGERG